MAYFPLSFTHQQPSVSKSFPFLSHLLLSANLRLEWSLWAAGTSFWVNFGWQRLSSRRVMSPHNGKQSKPNVCLADNFSNQTALPARCYIRDGETEKVQTIHYFVPFLKKHKLNCEQTWKNSIYILTDLTKFFIYSLWNLWVDGTIFQLKKMNAKYLFIYLRYWESIKTHSISIKSRLFDVLAFCSQEFSSHLSKGCFLMKKKREKNKFLFKNN